MGGTKRCSRCGAVFDTTYAFCGIDGTPLDAAPAPVADAWVGQVLDGRFAIESLLGEGGMGRVYRGVQQPLGRPIAVKVVTARDDERAVARFLREIKIVGRLNHPSLVTLYDYGQTPQGDLYLVMELIAGTTLEVELAKSGPLALDRAVALFGDMCSALDAAHGAGVVHRDFKPANVMLVDSGRRGRELVKVLDFGIAVEPDASSADLTRTGFVCGTPRYMSPEQAAGAAVDHRSDVYALGLVLYEMVAGAPPFAATSPVELMQAHRCAEPRPLSEAHPGVVAPDALEEVLRRALAKDPAGRPASAWALHAEVLAALRPEPVVSGSLRTATDEAARPTPQSPVTPTPPALKAARLVHGVPVPSYEALELVLAPEESRLIDAAVERCAAAVRAGGATLCIVRFDGERRESPLLKAILGRNAGFTWRSIDAGGATSGSGLASHVIHNADPGSVQVLWGLPPTVASGASPFYQGLDRLADYYEGGLGPCLVVLVGEPQIAGLRTAGRLWAIAGEATPEPAAASKAPTPAPLPAVNRIADSLDAQAEHIEVRLAALPVGLERARCEFRLAEIRSRQKQWSEAVALGSRAAKGLRDASPRELALACELLATATEQHGDHRLCAEWLGQASDAWNAAGDMVQVARLCAWSATVFARLGYRSQARTALETAARLERALGRKVQEAAVLRRLGALEETEGRADAAESRYRAALELSLAMRDPVGASRCQHYLGILAQRQGRFEDARGWHAAALEIDERTGDTGRAAGSLHQLGNVLLALRDIGGARACYERSLGMARALGDALGYALTERRLGDVHLRQSSWADALAHYSAAEERLTKLGSSERGAREAEMRLARERLAELGQSDGGVWRERSPRAAVR